MDARVRNGPRVVLGQDHVEQAFLVRMKREVFAPDQAECKRLTAGPDVGLAGPVPQAIMPIMPIDRITEKVRCADMRAPRGRENRTW